MTKKDFVVKLTNIIEPGDHGQPMHCNWAGHEFDGKLLPIIDT